MGKSRLWEGEGRGRTHMLENAIINPLLYVLTLTIKKDTSSLNSVTSESLLPPLAAINLVLFFFLFFSF